MDGITVAGATSLSPKLSKKSSGDLRGADRKTYGCDHLRKLLEDARPEALKQYTRIVQAVNRDGYLATQLSKAGSGAPAYSLKPTWLCLQCPNVATTDTRDAHDKGHQFCADSSMAHLYCRACRDIIHDPTLDEIRLLRGRKRTYSTYRSDVETKILAANSGAVPCRALGLRGMYNMGQTCFMSVVLQSLLHNPFIRAYYLAESHKSAECERDCCTSCALDDIFSEFHSQEKAEGYGMVAMLQASWRSGGSLAGYQQQDAHEYLQFILNSLHSANIDPDEAEERAEDCQCIIHKTFCGILLSTVTCSKCRNVTTARDPFMDLSLDIRQAGLKKKDTGGGNKISMTVGGTKDKSKDKDKDKDGSEKPERPPMALADCLDRFTSPETLPATDYTCRNCNGAQAATKRLRLSRLPPVVPMHLKRFSHTKTNGASIKLETRVRFPVSVDLGAYVSPASPSAGTKSKKDKADEQGKKDGAGAGSAAGGKPGRLIYELNSVIVHKGKMDSGHYLSYSRVSGEWFMFDDSKVVLVEENEVLASEAYMLFYVVRDLDV